MIVELFPYDWYQAEYRTLAKMAGKQYLSWKNTHPELSIPDPYASSLSIPPSSFSYVLTAFSSTVTDKGEANKQATTIVKIEEFRQLMDAAVRIARSYGDVPEFDGLRC